MESRSSICFQIEDVIEVEDKLESLLTVKGNGEGKVELIIAFEGKLLLSLSACEGNGEDDDDKLDSLLAVEGNGEGKVELIIAFEGKLLLSLLACEGNGEDEG